MLLIAILIFSNSNLSENRKFRNALEVAHVYAAVIGDYLIIFENILNLLEKNILKNLLNFFLISNEIL